MSVATKTVYETRDGKSFRTMEEAEAHDARLISAALERAEGELSDAGFDATDRDKMWSQEDIIRAYFDARREYER